MTEASDLYDKMRVLINKLAESYIVLLVPSAVDEAPLELGDMGSATFNTLWTFSDRAYIWVCLFHPN